MKLLSSLVDSQLSALTIAELKALVEQAEEQLRIKRIRASRLRAEMTIRAKASGLNADEAAFLFGAG